MSPRTFALLQHFRLRSRSGCILLLGPHCARIWQGALLDTQTSTAPTSTQRAAGVERDSCLGGNPLSLEKLPDVQLSLLGVHRLSFARSSRTRGIDFGNAPGRKHGLLGLWLQSERERRAGPLVPAVGARIMNSGMCPAIVRLQAIWALRRHGRLSTRCATSHIRLDVRRPRRCYTGLCRLDVFHVF